MKLLELINPEDLIVDQLFAEEILASTEKDEILQKSTTKENARRFLDILPSRGSKAFGLFLDALKASEAESHREAAQLLETTLAARSPRPDRRTTEGRMNNCLE